MNRFILNSIAEKYAGGNEELFYFLGSIALIIAIAIPCVRGILHIYQNLNNADLKRVFNKAKNNTRIEIQKTKQEKQKIKQAKYRSKRLDIEKKNAYKQQKIEQINCNRKRPGA